MIARYGPGPYGRVMRLLTLPGILRAAGLTVREHPGWRQRGNDEWGPVQGIICHHTGGSRRSTDAGELRTLLTGSNSAPAPIAQLYLSRSGVWTVVASGLCFHALDGWGGPCKGLNNWHLLGVEAQHSGGSEPWSDIQYRSYVTGVAALCKGLDLPPARVAGHREHQPGDKSDPTFDMRRFRAAVTAAIANDGEDLPVDQARFDELLLNALRNPHISRTMRGFPWQYSGGGIPAGKSTLGVLETIRQAVTALADRTIPPK